MIKYQSYKSSGVEWIGDIPFDWNLSKYKYKLNILSGFPFKSELFDNENGFPLLRIRDITSGSIETYYNGDFDEKYIIKRGDLVIGMDGDFNIREWDNDDILLNQRCCKVQEYDGILLKFIYYTLPFDLKIINDLTYYTTVKHLSVDDLYNIKCVLPPINEQLQIVQFLDNKTKLLDKLISTKERKITLLKEQRISLINQVVTKGLNPNVKMKDIGVEWIGEIPENWSVRKLNYLCKRIGDGLHSTPIYTDNSEYYFINGNNIKENKIVIYENTKTIEYEEYKKYFIELDKNNTLLMSINGTIGSLGYYNDEKVILGKSISYINVIPNSINLHYLFYLLGSSSIQNYFTFELTGTTIYNLSLNSIRKTPICLPDKTEQVQIVEFLDSKTKEIDKLVQLEQKKIDLLKEYRESLISEVVTGKIKVIN